MARVQVLFIKSIYWSEDFFEAMPGNYYTRHAIGMLGQGLLMWAFMTGGGHYYIQGVGYATINDLLTPANFTDVSSGDSVSDGDSISNPTFYLLLFIAKFFSTNLTIGSGASGGVFSPSLFVGATLGGAWGHMLAAIDLVAKVDPNLSRFDPVQSCVAGMAGMIGGSTGASVTAIVMTFEMTRDYSTILPIIVTTVLAHMTRKAISEDSIYTLKLVRRGHVVPEGLQAAVYAAQRVQDVMTDQYRFLAKHERITKYNGVTIVVEESMEAIPAQESGAMDGGVQVVATVLGPVTIDFESTFSAPLTAAEYAAAAGAVNADSCVVGEQDDLHAAIRQMSDVGAQVLLVSNGQARAGGQGVLASNVVGVVTPMGISENVSHKSQLMARDRTLAPPMRQTCSNSNMQMRQTMPADALAPLTAPAARTNGRATM